MADLYNLLDELVEEEPNDAPQEEEVENGPSQQEDDDDLDRERLHVPPALAEAARQQSTPQRRGGPSSSQPPSPSRPWDASPQQQQQPYSEQQDEQPLNLEDFVVQEKSGKAVLYTQLEHWWRQELFAPELLPYQDAVLTPLLEETDLDNNDPVVATGNADMDALLSSLVRIDRQRVQFVAAHLLRTRLFKMQQHARYIAQHADQRDRLSQAEMSFLQEYGTMLDRHLQRTVTDGFPQDVWKRLDEPEMMDAPDLEGYVFCRILEACSIDKTNNKQEDEDHAFSPSETTSQVEHFEQGTCLIVQYHKIRHQLEQGQIELLM